MWERTYIVANATLIAHESVDSSLPGVYLIINTVNRKCYVGSSVCLASRLDSHRKALIKGTHYNRLLQRSWTKYGELKFEFVPIVNCERSELIPLEQELIDKLKAADPSFGFNLHLKADSSLGYKRSIETRLKIAAFMKGKKPSPEMIEAARKVNTGKRFKRPPEFGAKISASRKGMKLSEKHRAAISKAGIGRTPSEETRAKLRTAQQNRSAETIEKMVASHRGRKRSKQAKLNISIAVKKAMAAPEVRAKLRKAQIGRVTSGEARAKMSFARRGKALSVETKARMSEAAKERWRVNPRSKEADKKISETLKLRNRKGT